MGPNFIPQINPFFTLSVQYKGGGAKNKNCKNRKRYNVNSPEKYLLWYVQKIKMNRLTDLCLSQIYIIQVYKYSKRFLKTCSKTTKLQPRVAE